MGNLQTHELLLQITLYDENYLVPSYLGTYLGRYLIVANLPR